MASILISTLSVRRPKRSRFHRRLSLFEARLRPVRPSRFIVGWMNENNVTVRTFVSAVQDVLSLLGTEDADGRYRGLVRPTRSRNAILSSSS